MARKREAFGLSLLDVLSNALVGAIVLMLIASVFTKVLNDARDSNDPEQGDSEVRTSRLFPPKDPLKSDDVLNIALTFKNGPGVAQSFDIYHVALDGVTQTACDTCIDIMRGSHKQQYWLVTRRCPWREGQRWDLRLKRRTNDVTRLPDSVSIHYHSGVRPLPGPREVKLTWSAPDVVLLHVAETYPDKTFSTKP